MLSITLNCRVVWLPWTVRGLFRHDCTLGRGALKESVFPPILCNW